jgi:hypothetical protein
MTIQQFIEKHSLSTLQLPGWKPAVFLTDDGDDPNRLDDRYHFYANGDRTIFVSINTTRNRFRIVYADMLLLYSNWERVGVNYELAPLITEQLPGM